MATDYGAVLAALELGNKNWGTCTTYADLERTWRDPSAIPTQAVLDAAWPAVEADLALINDYPTPKELEDVQLGVVTGAARDAVLQRRTDAEAARTRIP